ncbi:MAG: putative transrane sensor protein [Alphaproteobacteria bacterium]|nr:putative transrane sensor protein [Alphaproteobacteria bacterium]
MNSLRGGGGVFISHSADDAAVASEICEKIERRGIPCWIAPRDVRLGDDFLESIRAAIEAAPAFVLLLSRASTESSFVLSETEVAFSYKRPIFPVRIEKVETLGSLKILLSRWHRVDAIGAGRESGIRRLADAVARRVAAGSGGREARPTGRRTAAIPGGQATSRWNWRAFSGGIFWLFGKGAPGGGLAALCALLALALLGYVFPGGPLGASLLLLAGWIAVGLLAGVGGRRAAGGAGHDGAIAAAGLSCTALLLIVAVLALGNRVEANLPGNDLQNLAGNPETVTARPPVARADDAAIAVQFQGQVQNMVTQDQANATANAAAAAEANLTLMAANTSASDLAAVNGM